MAKKQIVYAWDKLPVVIDLRTVAMIFDVSIATVKNWLYSGKIRGFKVGSKWLFSREYIKRLTERNFDDGK